MPECHKGMPQVQALLSIERQTARGGIPAPKTLHLLCQYPPNGRDMLPPVSVDDLESPEAVREP